ncbi:hypothetical protein BDV12DRAFT_202111 [Aspergillus spectabilis]
MSVGGRVKVMGAMEEISKLWFQEAIPLLCREPPCHWPHGLWTRVEPIRAERRLFHANLIEITDICTTMDYTNPKDSVLGGLALSRLKSLRLLVDFGDDQIPRINARHLTELDIDPRHEVYPDEYVHVATMGEVLDQIPVSFV